MLRENAPSQFSPKPPLGVSPAWFVYPKRIKELAEAIVKRADFASTNTLIRDTHKDFELIAQWADELAKLTKAYVEIGGKHE